MPLLPHPRLSAGGGSTPASTNPSIASILMELDLLRSQSASIQGQLDRHRTLLTTSVSSIKSELQTLRDASSSQYTMTNRAMDIANESYTKVLECKSDTSALTLQFHTVMEKVERFMETYKSTPKSDGCDDDSSSSHPDTSSVKAAFQATEAALSDGLASMARELGSTLDRNIHVREGGESSDVRFSGVTYCPRSSSDYDSNAAYAAAHPEAEMDSSSKSPSTSPAASTTTIRCAGGGDGVDTTLPNAFGDGLSPRYNGPNSPRHRNALMRGCSPDILL
jgi:hypothetical protein